MRLKYHLGTLLGCPDAGCCTPADIVMSWIKEEYFPIPGKRARSHQAIDRNSSSFASPCVSQRDQITNRNMRGATLLAAAAAASLSAVSAQMLNKLAKDAGLMYFGTAFSPGDVNDAAYYKLESDPNMFGQWTPDNAQKWDATEPNRIQFSYGTANSIISRATSNKQIMRCHTLVWYSQLPGWGQL